MIKKLVSSIAIAGLAISLTGTALAASGNSSSSSATANSSVSSTQSTQTSPSYLFVISSQSAKITKGSNNQYSLAIPLSDNNQVLSFSDRPYDIVKSISADEFRSAWGNSTNSFTNNPPNAVLSSSAIKPKIITLLSARLKDNVLTFTFKLTSGMEGSLNTARLVKPVLTIDSSSCPSGLTANQRLLMCIGEQW